MSGQWVTIECERLAVTQLDRCSESMRLAGQDTYRYLDAVRCLHLAMIAAMTAALNGAASVGALTPKSRRAALDAIRGGNGVAFVEHTMTYGDLLEAVMKPENIHWGQPLVLSDKERSALTELDECRKLIDHPKPTSWSLAVDELQGTIRAVAPIVRRLMEAVAHHYNLADRQSADAAVNTIAALPDHLRR